MTAPSLPVVFTATARRQVERAQAWWEENRAAAQGALLNERGQVIGTNVPLQRELGGEGGLGGVEVPPAAAPDLAALGPAIGVASEQELRPTTRVRPGAEIRM